MRRRNIGILVTPYGTIEEHNLSIESSAMWGNGKMGETRPAWLTPDSLRKMPRGRAMAIILTNTIQPFVFPGETTTVQVNVKQRQALTEQYYRTVAVAVKDSVAMVIGLIALAVLGIILLLTAMLPGIYWKWQDEKNAREQSAMMEQINEPVYSTFVQDSWR